MNRIERIKKILNQKFKPTHLILHDNSSNHKGHNNFDGSDMTHLQLEISSNYFKNLKLVDIHREINFLIQQEFKEGLHAFEIKVVTD